MSNEEEGEYEEGTWFDGIEEYLKRKKMSSLKNERQYMKLCGNDGKKDGL